MSLHALLLTNSLTIRPGLLQAFAFAHLHFTCLYAHHKRLDNQKEQGSRATWHPASFTSPGSTAARIGAWRTLLEQ